MLTFNCPHCGKELKARPELAGKQGRCPGCAKPFTAPGGVSTSTPPSNDPARWAREVEGLGEPLASAAVRFISDGNYSGAYSNLSVVLMKYNRGMNSLALIGLAMQKDTSQAVAFINQLQGPAVVKEMAIVALHGAKTEKR